MALRLSSLFIHQGTGGSRRRNVSMKIEESCPRLQSHAVPACIFRLQHASPISVVQRFVGIWMQGMFDALGSIIEFQPSLFHIHSSGKVIIEPSRVSFKGILCFHKVAKLGAKPTPKGWKTLVRPGVPSKILYDFCPLPPSP